MFRVITVAGFVAAVLYSATCQADPPPAQAFGDLPQAVSGRLSPDGKRLALIKPYDGHQKVAIYDLTKADAPPYVVGMDGGLAGEIYWKSNNRLICIFHASLQRRNSREVGMWARALSVDPQAQTATLLMHNIPYFHANTDTGSITDVDVDDPNHVLMAAFNRWDRKTTLDLYRVDVRDGTAEIAMHGNSNIYEFLTDGHGNIFGQLEQDSDLTNHIILGSKEVYKYDVKGSRDFETDGLTDGASPMLAVKRPSSHGTAGLYAWSVSKEAQPLFEDASYDVEDAVLDEKTWRVVGARYTDDMTRIKYFDPAMQHIQSLLEKAYPNQSVIILSKDDAASAYLILSEGPRNPPVVSLYTPANHQANIVQEAYPALKTSDLGEVKNYSYKARDGLDIPAYLTLPPGKAAKNLPVVVFPHGGPEARDSMDFDWWAQFMASRGYAVLQPNYRGSSGYGSNFVKAGDGEWAGKVQDDLEEGVKKLVADGIADPKKVCIVGASWGGTLALLAASAKPGVYACAASFAGVTDMDHYLYEGTTFESEAASVWKRRLGADVDGSKTRLQSPVKLADGVTVPVLLIHSDKDTTVNVDQSEREAKALEDAGKQVQFITLEGDDHYLEYGPTRTRLLEEIEKFLKAHLQT